MQLFFEQLLNGIAMGSIYALITLGLALVYGILRILHVAHAAVYTVFNRQRHLISRRTLRVFRVEAA